MVDLQAYTREGLRAIIDVLPMAVIVINPDLSAILVNRAAMTFTQKSREQLISHVGGDILGCINAKEDSHGCGFSLNCTSCRLRAALTKTIEQALPQTRVEATMSIDQKGKRILRFSTLPMALDGEKAILLTIEDLTDAKRHEQEHLEKEKLAAVLETTGGICHELSQPLQVIMGYCDILTERAHLEPETERAITAIAHEVSKLAHLTHDLNHITRFETKPYLTSKIIDIEKSSAR